MRQKNSHDREVDQAVMATMDKEIKTLRNDVDRLYEYEQEPEEPSRPAASPVVSGPGLTEWPRKEEHHPHLQPLATGPNMTDLLQGPQAGSPPPYLSMPLHSMYRTPLEETPSQNYKSTENTPMYMPTYGPTCAPPPLCHHHHLGFYVL